MSIYMLMDERTDERGDGLANNFYVNIFQWFVVQIHHYYFE